jgi:Holliday junction resolvasome RuvABC endonuclease subunit
MKTVLSLDISSSTIGWAIIKYNRKEYQLLEYGHIKPPRKKQEKIIKLSKTYDMIKDLIIEKEPDEVAVEQYASKFSRGKSTANTIIVLSTYNETVKLCCYRELDIITYAYAPVSVRSKMSKYFSEKISNKDEAFDFVVKKVKGFKTTLNRVNNIKKECYDEADAICVGICHFIAKLESEE